MTITTKSLRSTWKKLNSKLTSQKWGYLTKGNDLKWKSEDNESEVSKIEKTLSTLLEKRSKLGGK